nr:ABC transporter permease [Akkermansiaceae bacterium]
MLLNALLIAIREIRRNLTRSFLTVVGIVIGVAAVVTMVTLGRGATETVKGQISKMGSNLLILRPGQGWGSWGAPQFTEADVHAVRDQVPGIRAIAPFITTNVS